MPRFREDSFNDRGFNAGEDNGAGVENAAGFDDETKTCVDCKLEFVFRQRDREFCEKNGWTPFKRCKPCRDKKKANRPA